MSSLADAQPMAILSAMISMIFRYRKDFLVLEDEKSLMGAAARLISKIRTIAAFTHRRVRGLPLIYPDPNLRYCANFLHMMFSLPYKQFEFLKKWKTRSTLSLFCTRDHEQN